MAGPASIKYVTKVIANDMLSYYHGEEPHDVPGNLPPPYYWWECGAMFGALIDYWFYTGDDSYNDLVISGMMWQASPTKNFMPQNQSASEGNDDQGFWGLAAMSAAERGFPDAQPPQPTWLNLAWGVFNSQALRWDMKTCAGGLKWQIFPLNQGYDYKNTISNGCFFNLAARLALYTGNNTFAEWADKTWDWVTRVGLVSDDWQVFDGTDDLLNCTEVNHDQWSYNAAVFLHGAAAMYNYTDGDPKWAARVQGLLYGLRPFFVAETNIVHEFTCEYADNCLIDQHSFKAYFARWLAATTQIAPFTTEQIMPKLRASAYAAAKSCTGGKNGRLCGLKWTTGGWDGHDGVGEEMAALEVIQANLVPLSAPPLTSSTGGESKGDPTAGILDAQGPKPHVLPMITPSQNAGAAVLTVLAVISILSGLYWVLDP
ncbi:hydrolase 76 protein [Ascosphaera acerosa]|nr:hydrolase 76 protein [Ascosphaera acerosa]